LPHAGERTAQDQLAARYAEQAQLGGSELEACRHQVQRAGAELAGAIEDAVGDAVATFEDVEHGSLVELVRVISKADGQVCLWIQVDQ